jgi:hypothetical protein
MYHLLKPSFFFRVILVCACFVSLGIGPSAHAKKLKGVYSVPIADTQLSRFAEFQLTSRLEKTEGTRTLTYTFPEDLVGPSVKVQFVETSEKLGDETIWKSSKGVAYCLVPDGGGLKGTTCRFEFNDSLFQNSNVSQFLQTKYANSPDLSSRLEVAARFENEPIGVMKY